MEQQDDGISHEEMESMLKKIDEQAARLSKTPTYDELKEYRTLIKNFSCYYLREEGTRLGGTRTQLMSNLH